MRWRETIDDGFARFACMLIAGLVCVPINAAAEERSGGQTVKPPIKVFILAGDDNVLEQAPVTGATIGMSVNFYRHPEPVKDERNNHVSCAVYAERWDQETDFDPMTPVVTGIVEVGEQRSKRKFSKKKGRTGIPFTPFPDESYEEDRTTVLRGYLSVPYSGEYLLQPGRDLSAFNMTDVNGTEVYRCWGWATSPMEASGP